MEFSLLDTRCPEIHDGKFWVYMVKEDAVIGTISVRDYQAVQFNEGPSAWVSDLFVHPNYRREGIASALLAKVMELIVFVCPNARLVYSGVLKDNHASEAVHRQMGFTDAGSFTNQYGDGTVVEVLALVRKVDRDDLGS